MCLQEQPCTSTLWHTQPLWNCSGMWMILVHKIELVIESGGWGDNSSTHWVGLNSMAIIIFILGSSPKAYSETRTEGLHIIHHVGLYNIGPFCQFGSLPFVMVCLSWTCSLIHMHICIIMSHQILSCICCDMNVQKCQWTLHDTSNFPKTLIGKSCKCWPWAVQSLWQECQWPHDQVPSAMPSRDASPIPNHATDHYDNLLLVMKSFVCEGSQSYRLQHWAISFHHVSHKETQFWESLSERAMALGCTVVEDTLLIPTWMWLADLWVMLLAP